jgi:hypothetical protein
MNLGPLIELLADLAARDAVAGRPIDYPPD